MTIADKNWMTKTRPDELRAAGINGGARKLDTAAIEALWDDVQAKNRAAGPWGVVRATGRSE